MIQNSDKVDASPKTEAATIERVERMIRMEAKRQHRGLTWLVATMFSMILFVVVVTTMKNSWNDGMYPFLVLFGSFSFLVYLAYLRNKRSMENPDVRGQLQRVRVARANHPTRRWLGRLLGWGVMAGFVVSVLAYAHGTVDLILRILGLLVIWGVIAGLAKWKRFNSRRADPEAWNWWNENFNEQ